jgi:hypothetical protein
MQHVSFWGHPLSRSFACTCCDPCPAMGSPQSHQPDLVCPVLSTHHPSLPQVAEAKASGVPVQIAVARAVTDVQKQVPLNAQVGGVQVAWDVSWSSGTLTA